VPQSEQRPSTYVDEAQIYQKGVTGPSPTYLVETELLTQDRNRRRSVTKVVNFSVQMVSAKSVWTSLAIALAVSLLISHLAAGRGAPDTPQRAS
jgi:hypothetical protein